LNRYSYAEENPINLVDPSGHDALSEYKDILIFIGVVAAGAGAIALAPKGSDALRKLLQALAVLAGFLLGWLSKILSKVTGKPGRVSSKPLIALDTNAVRMYKTARGLIWQVPIFGGELQEQPVITHQTYLELGGKIYIPASDDPLILPSDVDDPAIKADLLVAMGSDRSAPKDAIIGTTVLALRIPSIIQSSLLTRILLMRSV
jgi:hypothetical protein